MMISLLTSISAFVSIVLAFLAYSRNKNSPKNISFASVSLFIGLWTLAVGFYTNPILFDSLTWIKITYAMVPGALISLLYFSFAFPNDEKPNPLLLWFFIFSNCIILWTIFFTDYYVVSVSQTPSGLVTHVGKFYTLLSSVWMISAAITFIQFLKHYRITKGLTKLQYKYIFLGLVLYIGIAIFCDAIIPMIFHTTVLYPISGITSVSFVILTFYAIVKHRLLDIRFIIARFFMYILLLTSLFFLYIVSIISTLTFVFSKEIKNDYLLPTFLVVTFIALTLNPLKMFFEKVTNRFFHKNHYSIDELITTLTQIMASTIDLSPLIYQVLQTMCKKMHITVATVIVYKKSNDYLIETYSGISPHLGLIDEEMEQLNRMKQLLVFEELSESDVKEIMRKRGISIFLPLQTKQHTVGYLLLGDKKSGDVYFEQDFKTLQILAPSLAIALQDAQSFEEIKKFNEKLQSKIELATKDLRSANVKLQELDRMKDEFISIASHDLRTPMTAIKGYLWLMLKRKKDFDAKTAEQITRGYASIELLIKLTNDILDISRIEAGHMALVLEKINLVEMAREVVEELNQTTDKKLSFTVDTHTPYTVKADRTRLHQVFDNLVENAIKYTPENGSISVTFITKDGMVETSVTDTGAGIAESDIPKLFSKFGRLDSSFTAVSLNAGTGLGLYICKQIIERSGGTIRVKSAPGKGSTFIFTLPLA